MAEVFRFTRLAPSQEIYADGSIMPHLQIEAERQRPDGSWENVGYGEVHLHRVKVDATDVVDISWGFTARVNPKKGT